MSVRLMAQVFDLELKPTRKLVLLALADHARDDGTGAYPSISRLMSKCSLCRRAVQDTLRKLEKESWIRATTNLRGGRSLATEYTLTLEKGAQGALFLADGDDKRAHVVPEKGAADSAKGARGSRKGRRKCAPTINNRKEPSGTIKGARAERPPSPCLVLPSWIPGDAWLAYVEMRSKIRKPLTRRAAELVMRELEKLRDAGNDPQKVLEQSVMNSWQGVFPLHREGRRNGADSGTCHNFANA